LSMNTQFLSFLSRNRADRENNCIVALIVHRIRNDEDGAKLGAAGIREREPRKADVATVHTGSPSDSV
jgi:hypothetical protein